MTVFSTLNDFCSGQCAETTFIKYFKGGEKCFSLLIILFWGVNYAVLV
jgi:hypothetical protein